MAVTKPMHTHDIACLCPTRGKSQYGCELTRRQTGCCERWGAYEVGVYDVGSV